MRPMRSKGNVTRVLKENPGVFISGEKIARTLQISRCAVWKAVCMLRDEGYSIQAITKLGYRFDPEIDEISKPGIMKYLPPELGVRVETHSSLSSTNALAKERAQAGEAEGLVICADEQNGGRGRMGRVFFSPGTTGLYMSILLRPKFPSSVSTLITPAAAVAVARAIEEITGQKTGIKWVNDIFLHDRKVCGILTEAVFSQDSGELEYAILGIGVNVYKPKAGFPEELQKIAGAIMTELEHDTRNQLCAAIIRNFYEYYEALEAREFLSKYRDRSIVLGKKVATLTLSGEEKDCATVVGIDDDCNLILCRNDGSEYTVSSGEVRIKLD